MQRVYLERLELLPRQINLRPEWVQMHGGVTTINFIYLLVLAFAIFSCKTNTEKQEGTATASTDTATIDGHPAWIMQGNIYEVNVRQYTPEGTFAAFEKSNQQQYIFFQARAAFSYPTPFKQIFLHWSYVTYYFYCPGYNKVLLLEYLIQKNLII